MFGPSKYGWQEICSFAKCAIIQLFIPFRQKGKGIQKLTQLKLLQLVVRIVDSQMPFISQYISSFNN